MRLTADEFLIVKEGPRAAKPQSLLPLLWWLESFEPFGVSTLHVSNQISPCVFGTKERLAHYIIFLHKYIRKYYLYVHDLKS